MNLNNLLNIGASGLAAAQHGTAVTSHNLANAATEGFSRRSVGIEAIPLQHGGGARALEGARVRDAFLDKRSLSAGAQSGDANGRVQTLRVIDDIFADGAGDIGASLDAFESALSDFAAAPADAGARQALLSKATQLAGAFNQAGGALADARGAANSSIAADVATVNRTVAQLGELTHEIALARANGQESADLMDQRDRLVRDLSKTIPVTTVEDSKGNLSVMLSGSYALVDASGQTHQLSANLDPGSGDVHIYRQVSGVNEDVTRFIQGGTIGGTIAARDGALRTAQNGLDQLAFDVAQSYNAAHTQGVGLDGQGGRNLFSPLADVAGASTNFALSSDVAGNPNALAAASDTGSLPGDNRAALLLVGLSEQRIASGGAETAQSSFASIVAGGASALRSAFDRQSQADAVLTQVDAMRESAQGVSSDDEMISLMRYQRAYQASLRVIETADQMMQQLLSLGR